MVVSKRPPRYPTCLYPDDYSGGWQEEPYILEDFDDIYPTMFIADCIVTHEGAHEQLRQRNYEVWEKYCRYIRIFAEKHQKMRRNRRKKGLPIVTEKDLAVLARIEKILEEPA